MQLPRYRRLVSALHSPGGPVRSFSVDVKKLQYGDRYRTEEAIKQGDAQCFERIVLARNACKAFLPDPVPEDALKHILALTLVN